MKCNNNTGCHVPTRYATVSGPAMPEQMRGWGQAAPVKREELAEYMPMLQQVCIPEHLPEDTEENLEDYIFTPGFLRANIGNLMRVEFLIGSNTTDRTGILQEVGAEFIVLESLDGCSRIMCDIFSIRFVTILKPPAGSGLTGNFMEP